MSELFIYVIPLDPSLVPAEPQFRSAVEYLRGIAPQAREVSSRVSEQIEFVHAGGNFGKIFCPSCGREVELRVWQQWMDEDFDGQGFDLKRHPTPCCRSPYTLQELRYEWPQGFARSQIWAVDPGVGKLSVEQQNHFERILGCPVRIVYQLR